MESAAADAMVNLWFQRSEVNGQRGPDVWRSWSSRFVWRLVLMGNVRCQQKVNVTPVERGNVLRGHLRVSTNMERYVSPYPVVNVRQAARPNSTTTVAVNGHVYPQPGPRAGKWVANRDQASENFAVDVARSLLSAQESQQRRAQNVTCQAEPS